MSAAEDYRATRGQAIADGALVDVSADARRAGFACPVAFSRAAHAAVVDATPQEWAAGLWPCARLAHVLGLVREQVRFGDRRAFTRLLWVAVDRLDGVSLHMLEVVAADTDGLGPALTLCLPLE